MEESANRYNEKLQNDHLSSRKEKQYIRQNQCRLYLMSHENQMMVQSAMKTTLADHKKLLVLLWRQRETTELVDCKTNMFHSDLLKLGQECFRALRRLLDERLWQLSKYAAAARHMKIIFPASAYISGVIALTLNSAGDGEAAPFEGSKFEIIAETGTCKKILGIIKVALMLSLL